MRPERDNIAAPDLPGDIAWIGKAPRSMPAITAMGPVLVHFFDFSQLNSVRALPYVTEWDRRYRDLGLTTIGVQAPRFPFGSDPTEVAAPSWFHFGEGEYLATEEAIQAELRELDALRSLPEPMRPLRASDAPGVRVMPPTPEIFPGGSWEQPWAGSEEKAELTIEYAGGGAYATVEGTGGLRVTIDGTGQQPIPIDGPRLYAIAEHERHESHHLAVEPEGDLRIWSISFAAALP
jgi:hypothetical protein